LKAATIVLPKETTLVSLWVKLLAQVVNPVLLLIRTLRKPLGRSDRGTGAGYSNPGKRYGPGNPGGIIRTLYFSLPVSPAAACHGSTGADSGDMFWTGAGFTAALRFPLFRCANANGIAQTASSASRISALQRRCALMEG
jgi:hypothetical protein